MKAKSPKPTVWWALFSYRGRLSRQSYLLGAALMLVMNIYIVLNTVFADQNDRDQMAVWGIALIGFWFFSLLAVLALSVKRLHDLDLPGIWVVCLFFPIINMIFVITLMMKPGSQKTNEHGPPPFPDN